MRESTVRILKLIVVTTVLGTVAGCATVQPWERDILSRPGMTPGEDVVMSALDEHIYFSKEASTGGLGSGGGGCGCN